MNPGSGFSIPRDKGVVIHQNGDIWIPATPEKPNLQRSTYVQPEIPQNQTVGSDNWEDLLGIYTGFLQDEPSNVPPQKFNPNMLIGPNQTEHNVRLQQSTQDVAPVDTCNGHFRNFNPNHGLQNSRGVDNGHFRNSNPTGLVKPNHELQSSRGYFRNSNPTGLVGPNHGMQNSRGVAQLETYDGHFRNFNQTGLVRLNNPREQSLVEVVTPQKVDSLAELMGIRSAMNAPTSNRSNYAVEGSTHIQGESNVRDYTSLGAMLQQGHVLLHANQDNGGYNLQETPNGRISAPYWPKYNLNLPPRSEAGESSSSVRPLPLGPVTPDQQKQSKSYQITQVPHLLIGEIPAQEKNKQDNNVPEILETEHNELVKNNSNDGNGGIDLNKTPQQKPPKRRKHRPKVVIEGKPKRTPKSAAKKTNTTPDGNPTPKRKYERKNGVKTSKTPSTDPQNVVEEASNVGPTAKSCKRALNFDLDDNRAEKEGQVPLSSPANVVEEVSNVGYTAKSCKRALNFDENEGSKVPFNLNLNLDSNNAEWSTELNGHQNTYWQEKQQTEIANNFVHPQEPLQFAAAAPPSTSKGHTLNIIARTLMRNASINQNGSLANLVVQANTSGPNLDQTVRNMPQIRENLVDANEKRGSKREYSHPQTITLMGSRVWSQGISEMGGSSKLLQNGLDSGKKKRVEDKFHGIINVEDYSGQSETRVNKSFPPQSSTVHQNVGLTNSNNKSNGDWYMNAQDSRREAQLQLYAELIARSQTTNSLNAVTNWNLEPVSKQDPRSTPINENIISPDRVAVKKRTSGQTSSKKVSIMNKSPQQDTKNSRSYVASTKKVTGVQEMRNLFSVDYLIDMMKFLHINSNGKEIVRREQNALVPFKGENGAVVPYEEFDPIKRRKPRPKVDLDPETNRLWNLLMGKEGSESADTMDSNKQKWWEEERKVFRGRVDSFIARMHLVQGDRRFSKWKGSVVDSVIGVFLTQNVSDHLSSSAFMCLAAKFPLKPTPFSSSVEKHQEVRITYPDGSTTSYEPSEWAAENNNTKGKKPFLTEENLVSSQSSSESVIIQPYEDIKSSSGSNSETEDGWNFSKNQQQGHQSVSQQAERFAALRQFQLQLMQNQVYMQNAGPANAYSYPFIPSVPHHQSSVPSYSNSQPNTSVGLEQWEARILGFSGKESMSSLASTITHDSIGQSAQSISPDGLQNRNGQHGNVHKYPQMVDIIADKGKNPEKVTTPKQPAETGQVHSSGKLPSQNSTTAPNERKRKAEKEKTEPFDWDSLRKEAQLKSGTRERRREAMDSLDYEALRNADVRVISDTIKERGMNNMLAERMKDFLNRLVRDHERVDLEWLRDVQPDKTKDYLLSIRGLGLKSVECIRLLTLHHLAFPVDTNVGRIAVRLGWVPLQPLPESLQLHLLEMYPVLDSIQKYLWPRLCKLDQETLYELHYQMITFGKVFCTKREPNCNACPMRGECRHFASAFASARLALPGPEEKRIVPSAAPTSANKIPNVVIKPMALLQGETNLGSKRNCDEPLIEEPSSPEPPVIEVSERDIEDAFYEDPDEIPVIKLNVEEFTTNLQSFMQEQMEVGEADMSKALVALSPEFASIPTAKLKHVSRLRTEHQVYELPDLHPLLKGMDRREPDDPSPYLLAIWTPGETADSFQPPEGTCSSQEGGGLGMCNKSTCFSCNSTREAQAQTVRGTILVPCRTAMRGSFPLNGTYFQVNEVFADHESSLNPIDVPRNLLWNLPRRTVFFGTSVSTIFKGLTTEGIQYCFWKGFVCVRGFDQKTRAPRPLKARLHLPASKMVKQNE